MYGSNQLHVGILIISYFTWMVWVKDLGWLSPNKSSLKLVPESPCVEWGMIFERTKNNIRYPFSGWNSSNLFWQTKKIALNFQVSKWFHCTFLVLSFDSWHLVLKKTFRKTHPLFWTAKQWRRIAKRECDENSFLVACVNGWASWIIAQRPFQWTSCHYCNVHQTIQTYFKSGRNVMVISGNSIVDLTTRTTT